MNSITSVIECSEVYENSVLVEKNFFDAEFSLISGYKYDKKGNLESITKKVGDKYIVKYQKAEALYNDIHAKKFGVIPTTGKDIERHVAQITPDNVLMIMDEYKKLSNPENPENGESLIAGIIEERGLSTNERIKLINHIRDAYFEYARNNNRYTADMEANFDKELKFQMKKMGFAKADYLDIFTKKVANRWDKSTTKIESKEISNIPANGKVDGIFTQGDEGDCWLLSSIKAIANTPKGLQILNNSLSVDKNDNVKVTLKGVGKSYTITRDELYGNTNLSFGDLDVRAIEIAVDKYFYEQRGVSGSLDIDGNYEFVAYKILTGIDILKESGNDIRDYVQNITDSQINNFNKKNHIACVSSQSASKKSKALKASDGEVYLKTHHSYAVLHSDKNYVYLIDPHNTSIEIPVDRKTFKEFFNFIMEMDL